MGVSIMFKPGDVVWPDTVQLQPTQRGETVKTRPSPAVFFDARQESLDARAGKVTSPRPQLVLVSTETCPPTVFLHATTPWRNAVRDCLTHWCACKFIGRAIFFWVHEIVRRPGA